MNYYIQGDAANAEQIKAAFEKLGIASNADRYNYKNDNVLYFTAGGMIHMIDANGAWANIIKTHPDYKELELPVEPKFKVGDWLYHNTLGVYPILIKDYSKALGYKVECISSTYYLQKGVIENEYHLWSIADAKDGDVLATDNGWTCIFKAFDGYGFSSYCFMDSQKWFCEVGAKGHTLDSRINGNIHPATQKQRNLFFKKMQEAGYQWYAGKKELRKIKPHYDIKNFYAGMPVLVRDDESSDWRYVQFSHTRIMFSYRFVAGAAAWQQCIPFEGNEHLLGTTDMCDEQYINW